jgi:acetoin utilization protein AcuB
MLVSEVMTVNPVTIRADDGIDEGLHLMRERKVRRLPVLDASGKMVGIVSDDDLLHASPSPATSLSVHELHYLLSKLKIRQVMSSPVITVTADTPLEEAARIMADNKIGGLPVVDEKGALVGIVTETDIFKALLTMLGARTPGLRVTLTVKDRKGTLAQLTDAIAGLGGNIISLATYALPAPAGAAGEDSLITVKVNEVEPDKLKRALADLDVRLVDFR